MPWTVVGFDCAICIEIGRKSRAQRGEQVGVVHGQCCLMSPMPGFRTRGFVWPERLKCLPGARRWIGIGVGGRPACSASPVADRFAARRSVCLFRRAACGASAAMRCAAPAGFMRPPSASGTTAVRNPAASSACGAVHRGLQQHVARQRGRPARALTSCASRGAMGKPSLAIGAPKRADAPARRMSQQLAISSPAPMQLPSICATSGTVQSSIACSAGPDLVLMKGAQASLRRSGKPGTRRCRHPRRSAPPSPADDHASQRGLARQASSTGDAQLAPHAARHGVELRPGLDSVIRTPARPQSMTTGPIIPAWRPKP